MCAENGEGPTGASITNSREYHKVSDPEGPAVPDAERVKAYRVRVTCLHVAYIFLRLVTAIDNHLSFVKLGLDVASLYCISTLFCARPNLVFMFILSTRWV